MWRGRSIWVKSNFDLYLWETVSQIRSSSNLLCKFSVSIASFSHSPSICFIDVMIIWFFSDKETNVSNNLVSIAKMILPLSITCFTQFLIFFCDSLFPHLNVLTFCRVWLLPIIMRVLHWATRLTWKRLILVIESRVVFMDPREPEAVRIWVSYWNCVEGVLKSGKVVCSVIKLIRVFKLWVLFHHYHVFKHICWWNDLQSKSNIFKFFRNSVKVMFLWIVKCNRGPSWKHVQKEEKDHTSNSPH